MQDMDRYFRGEALWGDDFAPDELEAWWKAEEEGYSGLIAGKQEERRYSYHALNRRLFFDRYPVAPGARVLGLGSALGHELLPIKDRIGEAVIVDPSDSFARHTALGEVAVRYLKARVDGAIDCPDHSFDIVTCFGVLHHIANVSTVMREAFRALKPGGVMFCREPIVTQGDWRRPRAGLTRNERGIPLVLFRRIAVDAGFEIERATLYDFAPFQRVMANLGKPAFSNALATWVDAVLSRLFAFNTRYHRPRTLEKFGPASLALVLRKPAAA